MQVETFQSLNPFHLSAPVFDLAAATPRVLVYSNDQLFIRVLQAKADDHGRELWVCHTLEAFLETKNKTAFDFSVVDLCSGEMREVLNTLSHVDSIPLVLVANSPRQLRLAEWSSHFHCAASFLERKVGATRILEKGRELAGFSRVPYRVTHLAM